jgi:hypothetical protein
MKVRRQRRVRLKSKRRSGKNQKASRGARPENDSVGQIEPAHNLLLSSLRFWEVQRDLIEERVAAIGR